MANSDVKNCLHCQYKFWIGNRHAQDGRWCSSECKSTYNSLVRAGFVKFGEFSEPKRNRGLVW